MDIFRAGVQSVIDYVTVNRAISLTIAFFLSGAITEFLSQGAVLKYFGPKSNKVLAYLIASVSGAILTVCSCSVLPMFASIRKKGAGIGPAVTFLFAGPSINVLAIVFTFTLVGVDIGFVRIIGAVILSIVIGLIMFVLYNKSEETDSDSKAFVIDDSNNRTFIQNALYFATLLGILVAHYWHPMTRNILVVLLFIQLYAFFDKEELLDWGVATWDLAKRIIPLFFIGVFLAGIIEAAISQELMASLVGNNSYAANLLASSFGALMYFATLTEVPIVNSFLALGMFKGPASALLIAGPSLSIPNMIVISKVLGIKKTATYISLVVVLAAIVGTVAGALIF